MQYFYVAITLIGAGLDIHYKSLQTTSSGRPSHGTLMERETGRDLEKEIQDVRLRWSELGRKAQNPVQWNKIIDVPQEAMGLSKQVITFIGG